MRCEEYALTDDPDKRAIGGISAHLVVTYNQVSETVDCGGGRRHRSNIAVIAVCGVQAVDNLQVAARENHRWIGLRT